ncbi:hypothetical protein L8W40_07085 [Campylobacter sp. IFREMER_LSEM_CL1846]|uniref:hypothetical protein n=1 Tax=Campylobacter sp. IFREMER_LSEM_CL1846 TaxID=2911614 RepID=UPI001277A4F2|nr:hypothetical protein [Campylobacter sp. IFREMER_LSEM_CL1846]EAK0952770.1 hypothetical protein [Campylobacter lari]MCV3434809.1 hypothetical protein [Campylobacter sp. IFREMER_LSEM_CL1846]HEC1748300.1 hypothetical protein [Campylobacter lari]HEC1769293.1 hypothetical protein [Campylobacter lari]HEC1789993.1 hypothetical protein [Campylobacter lari]
MFKIFLYILAFFAILLFFIFLRKKIGKISNYLLILVLILMIVFAIKFELSATRSGVLKKETLNAFLQGQSLICKDVNVTKEYFNFEHGTQSFISNGKNKQFKAYVFDIKDCKVDK